MNVLGVVVKEAKDISQVIDTNRYSTFGKLLRVVVVIIYHYYCYQCMIPCACAHGLI